jgi:hypothetical protein
VLERVDSSSDAFGTAVNNAITALVPIIANAPTVTKTRNAWLERLYDAYQDDAIPYIELLGDRRGELCASKEYVKSLSQTTAFASTRLRSSAKGSKEDGYENAP